MTSPVNFTCSHTVGCRVCSNPTGFTVIISQPTSNVDPESSEGKSQPIPLPMPMPMPPAEPLSPTSAAGEENPGETLPESK